MAMRTDFNIAALKPSLLLRAWLLASRNRAPGDGVYGGMIVARPVHPLLYVLAALMAFWGVSLSVLVGLVGGMFH